MNRSIVLVFVVFASVQFSHVAYAQKQQATLEFRLAANAPTDNWTKHAVPDADEAVFVAPKPVLTGRDIEKVSFFKDETGRPAVGFTLTDKGSAKMWKATSQNIGKRLAILLDGKVVSAPIITSGIKKEAVISGKFDNEDLLRFFTAIVLRSASEKD